MTSTSARSQPCRRARPRRLPAQPPARRDGRAVRPPSIPAARERRDSRGQASQQGGSKTAEVQGLQVHSRRHPSQMEVHYKIVVPPILALPKSFQRRGPFSEMIIRMLIGGNLRCGAKWMQEPRWNRAFPVVSGYTTARRGSWLSQTLRANHEHGSPKCGVALAGSEPYLAPVHYPSVMCRSSPNPARSGQPCCGEGPQIYPSHNQRWPLSRLCRFHFAGPPGLHVVCHPGRPQSL